MCSLATWLAAKVPRRPVAPGCISTALNLCGDALTGLPQPMILAFGTSTAAFPHSCASNAPAQGSCHAALSVLRQPSTSRVNRAPSVSSVWRCAQQHSCSCRGRLQHACGLRGS